MRSGSLLLKNDDGRYVEAPRLGTDIDLTVSGPTIRARVTQIFHNPTDGWVEAVYVYPLADAGAVDSLKMVVGDRVIIGDIKERQQARQIYEQAKAAGPTLTFKGLKKLLGAQKLTKNFQKIKSIRWDPNGCWRRTSTPKGWVMECRCDWCAMVVTFDDGTRQIDLIDSGDKVEKSLDSLDIARMAGWDVA